MNVELVFRTGEWDSVLDRRAAEDIAARFADLVERQSRFVFRVAYAVLRNADDAEDVVQDTFLKLFRNGSWRNMEDERAFLARAAWRIATGRKRRPTNPGAVSPSIDDPEHAAVASQRTARLHALIDSLPEKLRRPLALSALQELTTAQIAAIMGEPEGTLRRRIAEARALLKQKWERMERHA